MDGLAGRHCRAKQTGKQRQPPVWRHRVGSKAGNVVTNGPYVEIKELIGGYSMIKCDTLEEATEISKGCPILLVGGNVEVRQVVPMNM
jgi:hypothetical protein